MGCETVERAEESSRSSSPRRASRCPARVKRPRMRSCTRSRPKATLRARSTASERWSASSCSMRSRNESSWSCRTSRSACRSCSLRVWPASSSRRPTSSSAKSRALASRTTAAIVAASRAISAWRPSGLSWRRSSPARSLRRVRFASIASSLRSVFSLRRRCLRMPAASSMNPRRSSGDACSTVSSRPCPTMTCISRPRPESLSSSCTSSSRQVSPLIAYSLAPLRKSVRLIVTSEYSIGNAPSALSIVSCTSARPSGPRVAVPAKMTSSIFPPRSVLAPCSPITQARASTTFDLPDPFGPTMHVTPGSSAKVVGCANDLNPLSVTLFRCMDEPLRAAYGYPDNRTRRSSRPSAGGADAAPPRLHRLAEGLDGPPGLR